MKTIKHTSTLFYYDGPQVFEARDEIGGHYIGVMVPPDTDEDRFIVTGVSPERLRQFRTGGVDLRTLLLDRGEEWFLTYSLGLEHPLTLLPQRHSLEETDFLPEPGFLLHDHPAETALQEARSRNNLVLEISADPPEAAEEHRIRVGTLVGLLSHTQTLIKHAYNSALHELTNAERKIVRRDAHFLDVVIPAAVGSFRVTLEAANKPDLFGHSELSRAMQRVDVLFENASNPKKVLGTLKANRGHLAGAYLRLLRFLVEHKTGLSYSWAEPSFTKAHFRQVVEKEAQALVEALSGIANLGSETRIVDGELDKVNRSTGSWALKSGEETTSGTIREDGLTLDGLKVGARYRFTCIEKIEEDTGTGRERHTLFLQEYEIL